MTVNDRESSTCWLLWILQVMTTLTFSVSSLTSFISSHIPNIPDATGLTNHPSPSPKTKQRSWGLTFPPGVQLNYRWWRKAFRKVCSFCWSVCPYLKHLNTDLLLKKLINNSSQWPVKPLSSLKREKGSVYQKTNWI